MAHLEHVNITVPDPKKTAKMLSDLFGWHTRWEGSAISGGYTVHVGSATSYVALYTGPGGTAAQKPAQNSYSQTGGFNHLGVVVDDLDQVEAAVKDMGFTPINHGDYEPGKRFYFRDQDGIEIEVVCYA